MPEISESATVLGEELLNRALVNVTEKELRLYLDAELSTLSPDASLKMLESLEKLFAIEERGEAHPVAAPDEVSRLLSRFLGRNFEAEGLDQEKLFEKFSFALNTLFDSLNRIMAVINKTLLGEDPEMATIRLIIGSNIDNEGNDVLLNDYMERIQRSFLIAHTSFQDASEKLMGEILGELSPENLSKSVSTGFKFGALRKAELFDIYDDKFSKLKRWHDSGHYRERLLREFEKRCQQQYK